MNIYGAWYTDELPNYVVVELSDHNLSKFFLTPFREITANDLSKYAGYHPNKRKGQAVPKYLYRFYGLNLIDYDDSRSFMLRVRLTDTERIQLQETSDDLGMTMSEYARRKIFS